VKASSLRTYRLATIRLINQHIEGDVVNDDTISTKRTQSTIGKFLLKRVRVPAWLGLLPWIGELITIGWLGTVSIWIPIGIVLLSCVMASLTDKLMKGSDDFTPLLVLIKKPGTIVDRLCTYQVWFMPFFYMYVWFGWRIINGDSVWPSFIN
jgi:hypothetical protein